MTIQNLGPMLAELQAVLQARGCKVTQLCVTLYPPDDEASVPTARPPQPHGLARNAGVEPR